MTARKTTKTAEKAKTAGNEAAATKGALPGPIPRSIVLVGLMGAGKTCIGRDLALRLHHPFVDVDNEIEAAAGCSIEDIFRLYGEKEFRDGERRVMTRLLDGPMRVLATGGGAFMDPETRGRIAERAISIWLRADLDLLVSRVGRRSNRPLLKGKNARQVLSKLIEERYPVYAEADITVDSGREAPELTVERVMSELADFLEAHGAGTAA
jgi:shikimate kinase